VGLKPHSIHIAGSRPLRCVLWRVRAVSGESVGAVGWILWGWCLPADEAVPSRCLLAADQRVAGGVGQRIPPLRGECVSAAPRRPEGGPLRSETRDKPRAFGETGLVPCSFGSPPWSASCSSLAECCEPMGRTGWRPPSGAQASPGIACELGDAAMTPAHRRDLWSRARAGIASGKGCQMLGGRERGDARGPLLVGVEEMFARLSEIGAWPEEGWRTVSGRAVDGARSGARWGSRAAVPPGQREGPSLPRLGTCSLASGG